MNTRAEYEPDDIPEPVRPRQSSVQAESVSMSRAGGGAGFGPALAEGDGDRFVERFAVINGRRQTLPVTKDGL